MIPYFLDKKRVVKDTNGIWVTKLRLSQEEQLSKEAWDEIYNYTVKELRKDKKSFIQNKLSDHLQYILSGHSFSRKTIYLEIGCGPAHIGEHLMKQYGCHMIGVDFNYTILLTLKKHFDSLGYKNYTLIHADINAMPIMNNSVDYIYGGGVIEHFPDTKHILKKSFQILKKGGVSFNTVPAFNIWWFTRFYNNIPSLPVLKPIFELLHITLLNGMVLKKYYGYELSYLPSQLRDLHRTIGFRDIKVGSFAFHPSQSVLSNDFLRKCYYEISKNMFTCPVYYVVAKK